MVRYVVAKKCIAIDFVFVEAEDEEHALHIAEKNVDVRRMNALVWNGDLPVNEWKAEPLIPVSNPTIPSDIGIHEKP